MKPFRALIIATALSAFLLPAALASSFHRKPTSASASKSCRPHKPCKAKHGAHVVRGQQVIDSSRATQIQTALAREHYLSGAPTGVWDDQSRAAMERYQAANGWQTKVIPDSRALIKLGLGPEAGVAPPAGASDSATAATATGVRAPFNPASPSASGKSPTLGSAISANNNAQNYVGAE